jgi:hypothetical protein
MGPKRAPLTKDPPSSLPPRGQLSRWLQRRRDASPEHLTPSTVAADGTATTRNSTAAADKPAVDEQNPTLVSLEDTVQDASVPLTTDAQAGPSKAVSSVELLPQLNASPAADSDSDVEVVDLATVVKRPRDESVTSTDGPCVIVNGGLSEAQRASATPGLSTELLSDLARHNPQRTTRSAIERPLNDYVDPGVLTYVTGGISQFVASAGLPPLACDSCETFSTVVCVILASLRHHHRLRGIFNAVFVNYLVYACSWLHQITHPLWSRGGTQRRPTVGDVASSSNLNEAFPVSRVLPEQFCAVPYSNKAYARSLVAKLAKPREADAGAEPASPTDGLHSQDVRGYVIVAGEYAFGVASLEYCVQSRLVSSTLVLCDSHGEMPWANHFACLAVVRIQARDYASTHRAALVKAGCANDVVALVDGFPTYEAGLDHFCRILFTLLEHCRREHGSTTHHGTQKYSTWVPIVGVQQQQSDEADAAATDVPVSMRASQAVAGLDHDCIRKLLKRSAGAREAMKRGAADSQARLSAQGKGTIPLKSFYQLSDRGEPVAPRPCWIVDVDVDEDAEAESPKALGVASRSVLLTERSPFPGMGCEPLVARRAVAATQQIPALAQSPPPIVVPVEDADVTSRVSPQLRTCTPPLQMLQTSTQGSVKADAVATAAAEGVQATSSPRQLAADLPPPSVPLVPPPRPSMSLAAMMSLTPVKVKAPTRPGSEPKKQMKLQDAFAQKGARTPGRQP